MAMCPRQHKRDILAQTSSGGEVLIFHNLRFAHRRKPWLLVTLQNVSRLQGCHASCNAASCTASAYDSIVDCNGTITSTCRCCLRNVSVSPSTNPRSSNTKSPFLNTGVVSNK